MPSNRSTAVRRDREDDPFALMRREMDRVFDDFMRGFGTPGPTLPEGVLSPRVNVVENEQGLEITAELPGVDQKDIELDLSEGILTLKAEHKEDKEEKDENQRYHVVERAYGTFMRRFAIPFEPDQDKVEASFDNGVLKVSIPRSPEAEKQTRKIQIKSS
ncbi:Hsp20/alpha crystallin family protein [Dichotomicrobium thermohalophilum]|nr:Hsp20/alpha crystallin family protein [Dichotomicrobium thermohalophilum]